jgi:inorganic pyrophosphatase
MLDRDQEDAKILAVPATDPVFNGYRDLSDVPQSYLNEVAHFFEVYKDLEGQRTKPIGWEDAAAAKEEILRSVRLYQERFGLKEL